MLERLKHFKQESKSKAYLVANLNVAAHGPMRRLTLAADATCTCRHWGHLLSRFLGLRAWKCV
jgi:hypothetical protein